MFDLAEESFDQIAFLVEMRIEAAPLGGCGSARNDGLCAGGGDGVHGALSVISFIGKDMPCLQSVEQAFDLGDVVAFPAGQDEANRIAQGIGGGMDLGAQAAPGASQRVSFKPIFGSIAFFGAPALC